MSDLTLLLLVIALVALVFWVRGKKTVKSEIYKQKDGQPNIWSLPYWIWRKTKEDEQKLRKKEE